MHSLQPSQLGNDPLLNLVLDPLLDMRGGASLSQSCPDNVGCCAGADGPRSAMRAAMQTQTPMFGFSQVGTNVFCLRMAYITTGCGVLACFEWPLHRYVKPRF